LQLFDLAVVAFTYLILFLTGQDSINIHLKNFCKFNFLAFKILAICSELRLNDMYRFCFRIHIISIYSAITRIISDPFFPITKFHYPKHNLRIKVNECARSSITNSIVI